MDGRAGIRVTREPSAPTHTSLSAYPPAITGKAPALEVRWAHHAPPTPPTHVGREPSRFAQVALEAEVKQALVKLRFTKAEATAAIEAARPTWGDAPTLDVMLREALKRCPRPSR